MKKCSYCGKDFEPKNPKGKFCSDKCRVYFSRKPKIQDLTKPSTGTTQDLTEKPPTTNYVIDTEKIAEIEEKIRLLPKGQYYNKMVKIYTDEINKLKYRKL